MPPDKKTKSLDIQTHLLPENQRELLVKYGMKIEFDLAAPHSIPELKIKEIGNDTLVLSLQEARNPQKRVNSSSTKITIDAGSLTIDGNLASSRNAPIKKGRSESNHTGDLHQTTILYQPNNYMLVTGATFDFNSPFSQEYAAKNMKHISKTAWQQLRKSARIRTPNLADHDVVAQQYLAAWPDTDYHYEWADKIKDLLGKSLDNDRGIIYPDHFTSLPHTQLKMARILETLWESYSLHLGDLTRLLLLASSQTIPEKYFAYNFNAIFSLTAGLIPLFKPDTQYQSTLFNTKIGLLKTLQSNADLLTTLYNDPKSERELIELRKKRNESSNWIGLEHGERTQMSQTVTMSNSNQNVERLLGILRKNNILTDEQIAEELIKKARDGTYLTLDTIRDSAPEWTFYQAAHSVMHPNESDCFIDDLVFSHQTDGTTHPVRIDTGNYEDVTPEVEISEAAKWQKAFEQKDIKTIEDYGKDDDASQLIVKFKPSYQYTRN